MTIVPNPDGGFDYTFNVPYSIGQQVYFVDTNNLIQVCLTTALLFRLNDIDPARPLISFMCKPVHGGQQNDRPLARLFGTMAAAVEFVTETVR